MPLYFTDVAGLDHSRLIYSVSMAFRNKRGTGRDLAIGYLDDLLIISFGMGDKTAHFVEVLVEEALKDHDLCSDFLSGEILTEVPEGIVL